MNLTFTRGRTWGQKHSRLLGERSLKNALLITKLLSIVLLAAPLQSSAAAPLAGGSSFKAMFFPVKGVVRDENNQPLPGATVKVKGTTTSVATDINGAFTINANQGDVLVVSFIGYRDMEVTVGSQGTAANVTLEPTDRALNEVVVVGFGTVKKRDLIGAVASVKPEEITARPGPNALESLQGRVAGLDITRSSGQAGAGVNLQLRGTRSFSASGTPLFIINGLPGDYATINPNDIESIEVLKDNASTAVYGSSGANGVVIITTKSGKNGKLSVDFNSYYGYNGFSTVPETRTGEAYLETKREAYKYVYDPANMRWTTTGALWQSPANDVDIFGAQRYSTFQQGVFTNWADLFLRDNPITQNYSVGVSGGTDKTLAYVSFNMTNEAGQYIGDDYKLYATSIRIDHKVRNWLTIGANFQGSYVVRNRAQDKLENAIVTDPLARPYKNDGSLNPDLGNNVYNLLLDYQPGVYANRENNTQAFLNPYIEVRPIKGLSILSRAGVTLNYNNTYRFDGIGSVAYTYNNGQIARARINQNRPNRFQWENILTYNFKIKQDHDFTFTGVTTYYHYPTLNTEMTQTNITSNNFQWYKFTGDLNSTAITSYEMRKTFALVGRVNYSYKGKYLLSASIRRDGASQLYYSNRFSNFPAVSAGWRISDENFMAGTKTWLNNLKLRATWGIAGAAGIPPYNSLQTVEQRNGSLGGELVPIFRNSQFLTNPLLTWERSNGTNVGIDMSMFKSRVDLSLDYYLNTTNGVIIDITSPVIYGTYTPGTAYRTQINAAKTRNKGFEVTMNTRNIVSKNFEWTSQLAFSANNEKVLNINGLANNIPKDNYTIMLGQPINSFRNFKIDGIWQIGEEADAAAFGSASASLRPGDLKVNVPGMTKLADGVFMRTAPNGTQTYYYSNLAAAQKFNPALTAATNRYTYNNTNDYQMVGHNSPDWSLGFQNRFRYKSFDLTVYTYMRWGQTISYNLMGWYQPNGFAINASPSRTIPSNFNYWTPTNPSNDFPVMNYLATSSSMTGFSGLNYVDGSFFKIKNISLGYTLPTSLVKKLSIQKLRVYGTVTNPLVIAKSHLLKDYDPEMNGALDYPLTKQVVLGLNLTF